jgi:undecaprenyl-diphosphatase
VILLGLWLAIDRRSRTIALARVAASRRGRRLILTAIALSVFAVIAEDVVLHEDHELVRKLDKRVSAVARQVTPSVRREANTISRMTGEGLAVAVTLATLGLVARGQPLQAAVLLLGTASAWAVSGLLKVACGVPRPRWDPTILDPSYSFPSGHALVTLVALALIARALGCGRRQVLRSLLLAAAWGMALLAGAARIVVNAHWASDVVAGLAIGAAWLTGVTVVAEAWGAARDTAAFPHRAGITHRSSPEIS